MADPFEVRMRFTNMLRQLNASVNSAQKAGQYALKNREMAEDLHSCILEQLGRNNMNTRANIMYFIEHFLDMAHKEGYDEYVRMIQRDIIRVVDSVAPDDGSGAANVKVVRKVLQALLSKSFLDRESVSQIEDVLRERDAASQDLNPLTPPTAPTTDSKTGTGEDTLDLSRIPPSQALPGNGKRANMPPKLDRKQVEQRIEEDRERHKRLREGIWAVPTGEYAELDRLWEETSDYGEDDDRTLAEEWEDWKKAADLACPHQNARGAGEGERGKGTSNGKHETEKKSDRSSGGSSERKRDDRR
ncbi:CTD kinase subunit gamma CTK3 domain containing protein [Naviculisporaceae sp. PSN 640]